MSFQPPSGKQAELASRKILEEIQMQKKLLKQGGPLPNPPAANPIVSHQTGPLLSTPSANSELHSLNPTQRAALQHAHSHSFGYFITQESAYGNLILPVIPRLEPLITPK